MPLPPARVLPPSQCNVNGGLHGLHGSVGKGGLGRGQRWTIITQSNQVCSIVYCKCSIAMPTRLVSILV